MAAAGLDLTDLRHPAAGKALAGATEGRRGVTLTARTMFGLLAVLGP